MTTCQRALARVRKYLIDAVIEDAATMTDMQCIEKLIEICDEQTDAAQLASRERDRWQSRYMERVAVRLTGNDSLSFGSSTDKEEGKP